VNNATNYKKYTHGNQEFLKDIFGAIGLKERLGYLTIELYQYVKTEYEKKRLHARTNFEGMFEVIVDIFDEGNNINYIGG